MIVGQETHHTRFYLQLTQNNLVNIWQFRIMTLRSKSGKSGGIKLKIQYYKEPSISEDYVEVHYREENERMEVIRDFFSAFQSITGKTEKGIYKLHPGSIYYLEVVDRKLFAYQEKQVYQLDYSLRHFLECFDSHGFVQIGKSTVVNLYKIDQVKADLNMRLRLLLDNGECLILNRTYKKTFLDALEHLREVCHENHK